MSNSTITAPQLFTIHCPSTDDVVMEFTNYADAAAAAKDTHWANMRGKVKVTAPSGKVYMFRAMSAEMANYREHGYA
jgi:hypothetical protein